MEKLVWKDQFVHFLIDRVRSAIFIWDSNNPFYKNKYKRQQFWLQLCEEMNKEFKPNTIFEYGEIMKKWNNLKSYFSAENQKAFKAQRSGASVEEVESIKNSWKFKSALDFLKLVYIPTPTINNFTEESLEIKTEESSSSLNYSSLDQGDGSQKNDSSCSTAVTQSFGEKCTFFNSLKRKTSPLNVSDKNIYSPCSNEAQEPIPICITSATSFHVQKKQKLPKHSPQNANFASGLIEASKELDQAVTQISNAKELPKPSSYFALCIDEEMSCLDDDLKVTAKSKIFATIMELQAQQIERNRNNNT